MQEAKIMLIAITLIQVWVEWSQSFPWNALKWLKSKLDYKPFNCTLCMSVWIGVLLSVVLLDPLYLTLPLFNKLTERIIY